MSEFKNINLSFNFIYLEETGSTNDDAIELGRAGAEHLSCVLAETQTAGRGRRNREWQTFPYNSIACSFVIRAGGSDLLPLIASITLCEVLRQYCDCDIKWPNDILADGKKLAGILVESVGSGAERFFVLGVGINVNNPDNLDKNFIGTTLENVCGNRLDRGEILQNLHESLQYNLRLLEASGWKAFHKKYLKLCCTIGKEVVWLGGNELVEGIAKGISEKGALLLDVDGEGEVREILSGDIVQLSSCG